MAHEKAHKFFGGFRVITRIVLSLVVVMFLLSGLCSRKARVSNTFVTQKTKNVESIKTGQIIAMQAGMWKMIKKPKYSTKWNAVRDSNLERRYPGNAQKIVWVAINGDRVNAKQDGLVDGIMMEATFHGIKTQYIEFYPEKNVGIVYFRVSFR